MLVNRGTANALHGGGRADYRRHRVAVAERLGEYRQIGQHALSQMGAAVPPPYNRASLVKHQQRPHAPRLRTDVLQEAGFGG